MRYLCSIALLWFCLINVSVSAPVEIDVTDPYKNHPHHDDNMARLKSAKKSANEQIDKMHDVIQNHHLPVNQAKIRAAFGKEANIPAIAENIHRLKDSKIEIPRLHDPSEGNAVEAFTVARTKKVHLAPGFHKDKADDHGGDEHRGGILIHEATHALLNAKDAHPVGSNGKRLTGYIHHPDFETLKQDHSHIMHKNADSYTLFGHAAMNGAHVLTHEQKANALNHKHPRPPSSSTLDSHTTGDWSGHASPWTQPKEQGPHNHFPAKAGRLQKHELKQHRDTHQDAAHEHTLAAASHRQAQHAHDKAAAHHSELAQAHPMQAHIHSAAAQQHQTQANLHRTQASEHGTRAKYHRHEAFATHPRGSIHTAHNSAQAAHTSSHAAHQSFDQAHASTSHMQAAHAHNVAADAHHNAVNVHGAVGQRTGHPAAAHNQAHHNTVAQNHHDTVQTHIKAALQHAPVHPPHPNDAHSAHGAKQSAAHAHQSVQIAHHSIQATHALHHSHGCCVVQ